MENAQVEVDRTRGPKGVGSRDDRSWASRAMTGLTETLSRTKRERLTVLSSRKWTHVYCGEWGDIERQFGGSPAYAAREAERIPDQRFLLFPNLRRLIDGRRILEIGCSDGGMLKKLKGLGAEVTGIDWKRESTIPEGIRGDFMTHPFPQPFDAIFAFGVFEAKVLYATLDLQQDAIDAELARQNTPEKMLARLRELLVRDGFCLFQTYVFPLVFTPEMARHEGFRLKSYERVLDSGRYGTGGTENVSITIRPDFFHVMHRMK